MSAGDLVRYLVIATVSLVLLVFGLKVWNKKSTEKRIVQEIRTLANPTSSFEQFYAEDAEKALHKTMAAIYRAETRLNREPGELLDKVFHGKGDGALFPKDDASSERYGNPEVTLIREGLLRNYQNCKTLGLFAERDGQEDLAAGKATRITKGPAEGGKSVIRYIIDPKISPGVERLIPNLMIGPPIKESDEGAQASDLQIKRAKSLADLLRRANKLEREAEDRIVEHYDRLSRGEPAPTPDPDPLAPVPAPVP